MNLPIKRVTIITGHYGSGKTNFAVNLAMDLHKQGEKVILADLDIVNPYFRSADFNAFLKQYNIEVVASDYANSNVDIPVLPARMYSLFESTGRHVILDVGGDDAGALALGRFSHTLKEQGNYEMLHVVNAHRFLTQKPEDAVQIIREVEAACRLKVTGIVNNSHLSSFTTARDILKSYDYGKAVAGLCSLPLVCTTAPKEIADRLSEVENLYPVEIYVKTPWEQQV